MTFLAHRDPCPACAGRLLIHHCNPCHRLFLHCEACEAEHRDTRSPAHAPGSPLPPAEHPTCPRCLAMNVRPATRSDLEIRGWLHLLASETHG